MSLTNQQVANKWYNNKPAKAKNLYTDGKTIYSYGSHFPIATKLSGERILFNGDYYSPTTARHQSIVMAFKGVCVRVIVCDTREIQDYLMNPEEPIIITKRKEPSSIEEAVEMLRTVCKEQGLKNHPFKKLREQLEKKIVLRIITR